MSKRMTETQIISILEEAEAGVPAKELCRKYGIASSTFYKEPIPTLYVIHEV